MVPNGAPAIIFRPLHDPGTYSVKVYIREAIDQGIPLLDDHTFEPLPPKGPFSLLSLVSLVSKIRKAVLNVFDICRQTGEPLPVITQPSLRKLDLLAIKKLKAPTHFLILQHGPRTHLHQQVKVISHDSIKRLPPVPFPESRPYLDSHLLTYNTEKTINPDIINRIISNIF